MNSEKDKKNSTPKFTHNNSGFECGNCQKEVPPNSVGCRNHCPFCLASKHVDINPGDRQNPCKGLMDAVGYELSGKKGLVLTFKCRACGEITRNIATLDDSDAPDDYDKILKLTPKLP